MEVPFYRPDITNKEITEVVNTLESGWLTTGPRAREFEKLFLEMVGAKYAIAVNSCTAAMHLAIEALGLKENQFVLVPTLTFAATAEVVRYKGAIPILVDVDPKTGNMDLVDAKAKLSNIESFAGRWKILDPTCTGIMPVHVGGLMNDPGPLKEFAKENSLWIVEDAAHAFPAASRRPDSGWQMCGQNSATVTCFSFYANKTITTGEGGMAVTDSKELAERMRLMSLHGLSNDAWDRYSGGGWDYRIVAPGYKYNFPDLLAAIGIGQLERAEEMRIKREQIARRYMDELSMLDEIELPQTNSNKIHSWHLFQIKLNLNKLSITRDQFITELKDLGVACSVHWRPLHLHPYYEQHFGYKKEDYPVASMLWERLVSLPIFSVMREDELSYVIHSIKSVCQKYAKR
jgi:dTDP-4-amino-4,6-dideoxygalactose transaminase